MKGNDEEDIKLHGDKGFDSLVVLSFIDDGEEYFFTLDTL